MRGEFFYCVRLVILSLVFRVFVNSSLVTEDLLGKRHTEKFCRVAFKEDSRMVEFVKDGATGMEKVLLREPGGATAQIHLYGGHVTSWKNEKGDELMFLSSKAIFKPPKAIRGGIPVCFPQFGGFGALEQHGFARNRTWNVDTNPPAPGFAGTGSNKPYIDLVLKPAEDELKIWPHNFELYQRIMLGFSGELSSIIRVRNVDTKPFTFTFALHTYLSVSDISEVRVEGLETLDYLDNLQDKERFTEQGDAITFDAEVDRIYLGTPTKIAIIDHEKKRTFVMKKEGLPDAVVWNPWEKKARAIVDFGDDEFKHMLCVEAAAVEKAITLKPGEEWKARQEISAVPSSYFSGQLDPCKARNSPISAFNAHEGVPNGIVALLDNMKMIRPCCYSKQSVCFLEPLDLEYPLHWKHRTVCDSSEDNAQGTRTIAIPKRW